MSITSYSRIQRRGWNIPLSGITVGPSTDHTDGTWGETDAYSGEIGINTNNGKFYYVAGTTPYTVFNSIPTGDTPTNFIKNNTTGTTNNVKYYVVQLPSQNYSTTNPTTITPLPFAAPNIISVKVIVYDDSGTLAIPTDYTANFNAEQLTIQLDNIGGGQSRLVFGYGGYDPTNSVFNGGFFNGETFTSTTVNRGYAIISYLS